MNLQLQEEVTHNLPWQEEPRLEDILHHRQQLPAELLPVDHNPDTQDSLQELRLLFDRRRTDQPWLCVTSSDTWTVVRAS